MDSSSFASLNGAARGSVARGPSLRVSLVYVVCIVLPVALIFAVNFLKLDAFPGSPRVATAAEQRAILTAIVEYEQSYEPGPVFNTSAGRQLLALQDTTVSVCDEPQQDGSPCKDIHTHSTEYVAKILSAPASLVAALPRINAQEQSLAIQTLPGIIPIDRERINAIFHKGGWKEFYRTYPQASGMLQVSRPALSARGDQAVLYVVKTYGYLGGEGWVALLLLQQGQWRVVSRGGLWVS